MESLYFCFILVKIAIFKLNLVFTCTFLVCPSCILAPYYVLCEYIVNTVKVLFLQFKTPWHRKVITWSQMGISIRIGKDLSRLGSNNRPVNSGGSKTECKKLALLLQDQQVAPLGLLYVAPLCVTTPKLGLEEVSPFVNSR